MQSYQYPPCMNWYNQPAGTAAMNMPTTPMPAAAVTGMPMNVAGVQMPVTMAPAPMNMPVAQMPMSMYPEQNVMPMGTNHGQNMMPMGMYPAQMNMPMMGCEEGRLEMMYPQVYFKAMPMIKHHCDMMDSKHGMMYCPGKEEMERIEDEVSEYLEREMEEDDDDCDKNEHHHKKEHESTHDKCHDNVKDNNSREDSRRRRYGRRRVLRDLVGVLLINELLGRRRPYPPYYGGYWY